MKIHITFIAVVVLSVAAFGQTKKPVRRTASKVTPKPKIYTAAPAKVPTATQKVYITKLNGELLFGIFLGGNTESVTIETNDSKVTVKLDEIERINFGVIRIGTRIGTNNAETTNDYADTASSVPDTSTGSGGSAQVGTPRKISGGVLNGKAETLVKPEYPAAARAVRASGAVNVQVTIDEQGTIISAAAVSGHPLLRQASENAARASKFVPTTLQGQPVQVTGIIVYNFVP